MKVVPSISSSIAAFISFLIHILPGEDGGEAIDWRGSGEVEGGKGQLIRYHYKPKVISLWNY